MLERISFINAHLILRPHSPSLAASSLSHTRRSSRFTIAHFLTVTSQRTFAIYANRAQIRLSLVCSRASAMVQGMQSKLLYTTPKVVDVGPLQPTVSREYFVRAREAFAPLDCYGKKTTCVHVHFLTHTPSALFLILPPTPSNARSLLRRLWLMGVGLHIAWTVHVQQMISIIRTATHSTRLWRWRETDAGGCWDTL